MHQWTYASLHLHKNEKYLHCITSHTPSLCHHATPLSHREPPSCLHSPPPQQPIPSTKPKSLHCLTNHALSLCHHATPLSHRESPSCLHSPPPQQPISFTIPKYLHCPHEPCTSIVLLCLTKPQRSHASPQCHYAYLSHRNPTAPSLATPSHTPPQHLNQNQTHHQTVNQFQPILSSEPHSRAPSPSSRHKHGFCVFFPHHQKHSPHFTYKNHFSHLHKTHRGTHTSPRELRTLHTPSQAISPHLKPSHSHQIFYPPNKIISLNTSHTPPK